MADSKADARFDALVSQVHDWTESAVALDEGHFPGELLSDLRDLIEELKAFLEEAEPGTYKRADVIEMFVTPEMAEVTDRFPKVRRPGLDDELDDRLAGMEVELRALTAAVERLSAAR